MKEKMLSLKKKKLVIIHPSPYPVKLPMFDIVCAKTDGVILFSSKYSIDHPEWDIDKILSQFRFKYKLILGFRIGRIDIRPFVFFYLMYYNPEVVVTTEFNLQTVFALIYAKIFHRKILIQSNATSYTGATFPKRRRFREWLVHRCDGFIANSSETKKYLYELGADPDRVFISIQTIDVHKWKRSAEIWRDSKDEIKSELGLKNKVILYVGILEQRKGIHFLLEAYRNVIENLKNTSILIIGGGSEEVRLKEYCRQNGLAENVVFAGYKQPSELPKYYALSDLFIFPTLWDPFGLVVIEALASGLPVLCSFYAGAAEDLIREGNNGYILEPRDIEKMSLLLSTVLTDEKLLEKLKSGALESIGDFSIENSADNFLYAVGIGK
jgi:glycosyltransferase involved in cell wall biosynthesis